MAPSTTQPAVRLPIREAAKAVHKSRAARRRRWTPDDWIIDGITAAIARRDEDSIRFFAPRLIRQLRRLRSSLSRIEGAYAANAACLPGKLPYRVFPYRPFEPAPPCVYFLLCRCQLVYIGTTRNLHLRVAQHLDRGEGKRFDGVLYLPTDGCDVGLEAALIRRLRPQLNNAHAHSDVLPNDVNILREFFSTETE